MHTKDQPESHDIPGKAWGNSGTDIFMFNNKTCLCIVDYHSKFPVMKLLNRLSADSFIKMSKIIFAEYGLPIEIMSDAGTIFVSEKF